MKLDEFRCDRCGCPLERHGKRYTVQVALVPKVRSTDNRVTYDLCEKCVGDLKWKFLGMSRKEGLEDA